MLQLHIMIRRQVQNYIIRYLLRVWDYASELGGSFRRTFALLSAFASGAQVRGLLILIVAVLVIGTGGYIIIEGWGVFDAFYMTMITISTVGFGETRELSVIGRLFTIGLIILAVTLLAYGISGSIDYIVTGQLLTNVAETRRTNMISQLKNHYILTGYGRVGQEAATALRKEEVPFVVVERDPELIAKAEADECLVVIGNATEDERLTEAGIQRANGIICATGSDATNVYIVLTARGLNPDLFVISRASDESARDKLLRAGADQVISPYILSGRRMANLAVRPFVVEFLDVTGSSGELEKTLEEIVVEEGSIIENQTIGEADLGKRTGALILAIYRNTGELLTNPEIWNVLEAGTRMIVLGTRDALDVTEALSQNFTHLQDDTSETK